MLARETARPLRARPLFPDRAIAVAAFLGFAASQWVTSPLATPARLPLPTAAPVSRGTQEITGSGGPRWGRYRTYFRGWRLGAGSGSGLHLPNKSTRPPSGRSKTSRGGLLLWSAKMLTFVLKFRQGTIR